MRPGLHEDARDHARREHCRARDDGAAVFGQDLGGNYRHTRGADRTHKTCCQAKRRDIQAGGVAAGGD